MKLDAITRDHARRERSRILSKMLRPPTDERVEFDWEEEIGLAVSAYKVALRGNDPMFERFESPLLA